MPTPSAPTAARTPALVTPDVARSSAVARAPASPVPASSDPAPPVWVRAAGAGTLSARIVVWVPPLLLLLSAGLGLLIPRQGLLQHDGLWALLPSTLLLCLRPLLERALARTGQGSPLLQGLYVLHLLGLAVGILLNPYLCIYAFVGYMDGERFLTGIRVAVVLVLTALLSAAGQSGGLVVILQAPWLYPILAAVNLLLAGGMGHLSREREMMLHERERALDELGRTERENARLHDEVVARAHRSGIEEERTRLSREIHDTVAQGLVGVIRQLEAVGPDLAAPDRRRVLVAEEAARDALLEARRAVAALAPVQLDDSDLPEALGTLVARWARSHRVVASVDADDARGGLPHGEVLLRIAQEALSNVARHARARSVSITLRTGASVQVLEIRDDGDGADPQALHRGHGLGNMAARAEAVGGEVRVRTRPGEGCVVTARVPT